LITITIFAPADELAHSAPRGFAFVDQVFKEAGYKEKDPRAESGQILRRLGYLKRRYPGRMKFSWINPWTPQGMWFAIRHRLRVFPSAIIQSDQQRIVLVGDQLNNLEEQVAALLSAPPIE
jgi:hypothetical protein